MIITDSKLGECQTVIKSEKGLVVFNSFWSEIISNQFKEAIAEKSGRNDFAYVIDAVDRLDMFGGNAAYKGAEIIGHKNFLDKYKGKEAEVAAEIKQLIDMWRWKEGVSRERLAGYEKGSKEAAGEERWMNTCQARAEQLEQGFSLVLPTKTFDDRMTLNLGNITLKLIWFGKEGNYDGMTVAVVPEEKVAIISGFIMHPQHLAPYPFDRYADLDIPRWIAVLEELLEGKEAVEKVLCGMGGDLWTRERAQSHLEYIRRLWNAVRQADAAGKKLAEIQDQFSLDKDFAFVKEMETYKERGDDWIRPQHLMHVKVFFLQGKNLASEIIKRGGVDSLAASLAKIRELREKKADIYFDEEYINGFGYYLIGQGKMPEALEVMKLNAEVFPESANAYDSMAEAFMKNGNKEEAIKNYEKSLALNPGNENAKTMLNELRK
jgi:tetratricopeptide (TPR) repeat protein